MQVQQNVSSKQVNELLSDHVLKIVIERMHLCCLLCPLRMATFGNAGLLLEPIVGDCTIVPPSSWSKLSPAASKKDTTVDS